MILQVCEFYLLKIFQVSSRRSFEIMLSVKSKFREIHKILVKYLEPKDLQGSSNDLARILTASKFSNLAGTQHKSAATSSISAE